MARGGPLARIFTPNRPANARCASTIYRSPVEGDLGVVPRATQLIGRVVDMRRVINESHRRRIEDTITMRDTMWNEQQRAVVLTQIMDLSLATSGRIFT